MSDIGPVRTLTPDDAENLGEAITRGFAGPSELYRNDGTDDAIRRGFAVGVDHPLDRGDLGATAVGHDLEFSVPPGTLVRAHGLTGVTVRPDLTRRGLLKAMMAEQFRKAREAGYAWSTLWATAPGIYGRFGYAAAIPALKCVKTSSLSGLGREGYDFFMTDSDRIEPERLRSIALAAAQNFPGMTVMSRPVISARVGQPTRVPHDRERQRCVIATREGVDVGYSYFSREWNGNTVTARTLVGVDADSQRAVASWLGALDFITTVVLYPLGLDSVALWGDLGFSVDNASTHLSQWVKLLDVRQALADRTYSTDLEVYLEVTPAAADNQMGTVTYSVAGAAGQTVEVVPTDRQPDLTVTENYLAQLMFGAVSPGVAVTSPQLKEHTRGAAANWARACATDMRPTPSETF